MAKRKRTGRVHNTPTRTLTSLSLPRSPVSRVTWQSLPSLSRPLTVYEDRRRFHPAGKMRPVIALPRAAARLTVVDYPGRPGRQTKAPVRFNAPKRVPLCVRREQRKEVLHATGKAGGRVRPPRRNQFSDISCK